MSIINKIKYFVKDFVLGNYSEDSSIESDINEPIIPCDYIYSPERMEPALAVATKENAKENDKGQKILRNLSDYRRLQNWPGLEFDLSQIDMRGENIQNIDLSNKGLNIDLNNICYYLSSGRKLDLHRNKTIFQQDDFGIDFIDLRGSKLQGNNVLGNLENVNKCVYLYNEDTFDDKFKEVNSKYFLDDNAPQELKDKFYNPITREKNEYESAVSGEGVILSKNILTFKEYKQNYQFLKGKYFDRFDIYAHSFSKIKLVEVFGIEGTKIICSYLNKKGISVSCFLFWISPYSIESIRENFINDIGIIDIKSIEISSDIVKDCHLQNNDILQRKRKPKHKFF